jgi:DNA-binding NarL/FixJ family response regulator
MPEATPSEPLKILVLDDHRLFAESLAALLSNAPFTAMVEYDVAIDPQSLQRIIETQFDLLLVDLRMPGVGDVETAAAIKQQTGARTVILSGLASRFDIDMAISLGLDGYLPKTMAAGSLLRAAQLIASGERFFPVESTKTEPTEQAPLSRLTDREKEVLSLLCTGASNKAIARGLLIDENAVKAVVRALCAKFGVQNRTGVVIAALKARSI